MKCCSILKPKIEYEIWFVLTKKDALVYFVNLNCVLKILKLLFVHKTRIYFLYTQIGPEYSESEYFKSKYSDS